MARSMTPSETLGAGKIAKINEILSARLRKSGLTDDPVQQALETNGDAIAEEMVAVLRKYAEATMFLAPRGTCEVAIEAHDLDAFYRTRPGLWVYDGFRSLVVSKAKPSAKSIHKMAVAELMRNLTDQQIESALPSDHLFGEDAVCAIIAGLIAEQPNGEEGTLLNNGYANFFYIGSCVVRVYWSTVDRNWRVDAWRRDDISWDAGGRVFSPATSA